MNSTQGTVEVPEERTVRIRPAGRVYYNRAGVQVTERWFATEDAVYPVAQLNRLRTGRGPLHPIVQTTSAVALVFASAFLVSLPTLRDTPAAWLTLAAVAAVPLVAAALAVRYQPRTYQIWADYRGDTVLVFSTLDEKTFGHVRRALIRARESSPPDVGSAAGLVVLPSYLPHAA